MAFMVTSVETFDTAEEAEDLIVQLVEAAGFGDELFRIIEVDDPDDEE